MEKYLTTKLIIVPQGGENECSQAEYCNMITKEKQNSETISFWV